MSDSSPVCPTGQPVPEPARVYVRGMELGPFATNCYIVSVEGAAGEKGGRPQPCWIVDASFGGKAIAREVQRLGLAPEMLILTHAHLDHIAGVDEVRGVYPKLPILIHEAEAHWPTDPRANLSAMSGFPVTCAPPDRLLRDGETLKLGESEWRVLHTPGHSPGGIGLYCAAAGTLIAGDTLFAGSVGRSDFPGSDPETLARSIRTRLYTLPEETAVYPGHGPATTIGEEKRGNPFVRP